MFSVSLKRALYMIAMAVVCVACVYAGVLLAARAWFFLQGAAVRETALYWTVGRAILNGYEPYVDIYENKPPTIFLLSALSLWMFGDGTVGNVLNAIFLLAAPIIVTVAVYRYFRKHDAKIRAWSTACAWVLSSLLSLYASKEGGPWQTEYLGAFFGIVYVVSVFIYRERRATLPLVFACLGCIGAIGFKEPYLFVIVACGLLLLPTVADLVRGLLSPLAVTIVAGVAGLLLTGTFKGYLEVYLPSTLGFRVTQYSPMFLRPFRWDLLAERLAIFSPLFAVVLLLLFGTVLFMAHKHTSWKRAALIVVASLVAYMGVGIGGDFQHHHFAHMVPFFVALFLLCVVLDHGRWRLHSAIAFSVLLAVTALLLPFQLERGVTYAAQTRELRETFERERTVAASIDDLLDRCDEDRYFYIQPGDAFYRQTTHTPFNFFLFSDIQHVTRYNPIIPHLSFENLKQTQIIVLGNDAYFSGSDRLEDRLAIAIASFIEDDFTKTPWPCVEEWQAPEGYYVLYRIERGDVSLPFGMRMD